MRAYDVVINNKTIRVMAEKIRNQLWFHYEGQTRSVDITPISSSKGSKKSKASPEQIFAPMPGKILKVLCQQDDKVSSGQTLVVMEAMKMEYTLVSEKNGQVIGLFCKEGDQVDLGQKLVQLKFESESPS
ncbi:MAG: acetyl-CoA carboxylase biotin carboxyl carrier protein subunit [Bdellovibrionota bacterium]